VSEFVWATPATDFLCWGPAPRDWHQPRAVSYRFRRRKLGPLRACRGKPPKTRPVPAFLPESVYELPVELALGTLYTRYGRSVFRRARTILGDEDAAKDAVQEVFLRVMREDDSIASAENTLAWLYRATTNLCLNRLRDNKRRREIMSEWIPENRASGDADARFAVRQILEQVPEELQDVAIYYYVDELSHEEIAEILGVSRRTVGNRLAAFHLRVGELVEAEPAP
jgi:RNA polymerase sigma-70 factor, ECF subfamily